MIIKPVPCASTDPTVVWQDEEANHRFLLQSRSVPLLSTHQIKKLRRLSLSLVNGINGGSDVSRTLSSSSATLTSSLASVRENAAAGTPDTLSAQVSSSSSESTPTPTPASIHEESEPVEVEPPLSPSSIFSFGTRRSTTRSPSTSSITSLFNVASRRRSSFSFSSPAPTLNQPQPQQQRPPGMQNSPIETPPQGHGQLHSPPTPTPTTPPSQPSQQKAGLSSLGAAGGMFDSLVDSFQKQTKNTLDSMQKQTMSTFDSVQKQTMMTLDSVQKQTMNTLDSVQKQTMNTLDNVQKQTMNTLDNVQKQTRDKVQQQMSNLSFSSLSSSLPSQIKMKKSNTLGRILDTAALESNKVSIQDASFRIVLQCSLENYVVAVGENEAQIRADWACIHKTVFPKVSEVELGVVFGRGADEHESDRKWIYELDRLSEALSLDQDQDKAIMSAEVARIFHIDNEELLCFYKSGYMPEEGTVLLGHIALTKNFVCWHNSTMIERSLEAAKDYGGDMEKIVKVRVDYKDIIAIDEEYSGHKGLAVVTTKDVKTVFVPTFHQREVLDMLSHFSNAYMRILVSGLADDHGIMNKDNDEGSRKEEHATSPAFLVNSTTDLKTYTRNHNFQTIFRLPPSEKPLEEFSATIETKNIADARPGMMYISQRFLCYLSRSAMNPDDSSVDLLTTTSSASGLTVVIPFSEIMEIKRDAGPTASTPQAQPISPKLAKASFIPSFVARTSAGTSISVKSRGKFWFTGGYHQNQDIFDALNNKYNSVNHSTALLRSLEIQTSHDVLRQSTGGAPPSPPFSKSPISTITSGSQCSSEDRTVFDEPVPEPEPTPPEQRLVGWDRDVAIPLPLGLNFLVKRLLADRHGAPVMSEVEMELECDWVDYFALYGRDICMIKTNQLQSLVMNGIPEAFRPQLWMILSGASYLQCRDVSYRVNLHENLGKFSHAMGEIEKDVKRSMPYHPAFKSPVGLGALRRVLGCYSWRNPKIGYAQSMNIVGAVLLLHLKEEDSYWLLATMCEQLMPDYYSRTLAGVLVDQRVFSHLVELSLPEISNHFQEIGLDLATITIPWLLCLYQSSLPQSLGPRVLDCFFYQGPIFLFMFGLAALRSCQLELLQSKNDEGVVVTMQQFFKCFEEVPKEEERTDSLFDKSTITTTTTKHEKESRTLDCISTHNIQSQLQEPQHSYRHHACDPSSTLLPNTWNQLSGKKLMDNTIRLAYAEFSFITSQDVDRLRDRFRMSVVTSIGEQERQEQKERQQEQQEVKRLEDRWSREGYESIPSRPSSVASFSE
ncbi:TBC1 domain member 9 [Podila humilis]|nr:TBC1 domain member 9 [Podila humilis]